jgi:hypothetical protein
MQESSCVLVFQPVFGCSCSCCAFKPTAPRAAEKETVTAICGQLGARQNYVRVVRGILAMVKIIIVLLCSCVVVLWWKNGDSGLCYGVVLCC